MDNQKTFRIIAESVLNRYRETSLIARWEDATAHDPEPKPLAFWIRESDDLVNIVWLTRRDVRDIAWFPQTGTSMFNILRVSAVSALEAREAENAAKSVGLNVSGNYVVYVHQYYERGGLVWAASSDKEKAELRDFVTHFLRLVLES